MNIYLIRHSKAVDIDKSVGFDANRYLSDEGRKKTHEISKKLTTIDVSFDMIFTSPLVRAVQTSEIIAANTGYKGVIKTTSELLNGASFDDFLALLTDNYQFNNIACIGHNPDLSLYIKYLLRMVSVAPFQELKPSDICAISYDFKKSRGNLLWILDSLQMKILKPETVV